MLRIICSLLQIATAVPLIYFFFAKIPPIIIPILILAGLAPILKLLTPAPTVKLQIGDGIAALAGILLLLGYFYFSQFAPSNGRPVLNVSENIANKSINDTTPMKWTSYVLVSTEELQQICPKAKPHDDSNLVIDDNNHNLYLRLDKFAESQIHDPLWWLKWK